MPAVASNLELLAQRLERDIRERGLKPGDRYLTADEAGQMLDVSRVTAHRAMKLLSDRKLLVRQRKSGTFVGQGIKSYKRTARQKVHIIISEDVGHDYASALRYLSSEMLVGITESLSGVSVQIDTSAHDLGFVRDLIEQGRENGDFAGAVLVRSSLAMQRLFAQQGAAAVVYGSLYPGVTGLGGIDIDQAEIGRQTAQYILDRGHRNVHVIMFDYWAVGDSMFYTHLNQALRVSGRGVQLDLSSLPSSSEVVLDALRRLFDQSERPDALVVRGPVFAQPIPQLAEELGVSIVDDVELIVANHQVSRIGDVDVPRFVPQVARREQGRMVAEMLKALQDGEGQAPLVRMIPVRMEGGVVREQSRSAAAK